MNSEPMMICGHCGKPMQGFASMGDQWLCHPDEGMDCYRLVTVYKHSVPCSTCSAKMPAQAGDRVSFRQSAAPGERFAPDAFAPSVGKTVSLIVGRHSRSAQATLVGAQVAEDGSSVWLTLELPEGQHVDLAEVFPQLWRL